MSDISSVPNHGQPEQTLVAIGDISMTAHWLVTPAGSVPLAGTELIATDFSRVESRTPTWAIVLAIVGFFFFFLGLLFLLVKDQVATGYVQVTARNGALLHTCNIPVHNAATAPDVMGRVQYARHLISLAG
ncbi:hypothetical protein [Agreia sp. COWG]|uniref:hypothetical protein n=1 Tax=Agreia sp. COWG TaxID=2773266 RepID=UPI0019286989|nr:hypothetical protein [Agreia sp. COWG]CAD5999711.1 conserved protein of unknown function [Agreia sp. COWG]